MLIVEKFKQYPLVLWALALYLCSLGFNLKVDVPLAALAFTAIYAFGNYEAHPSYKDIFRQHWHVIIFLLLTLVITLCSKDIKHSAQVQVQLIPALLMYAIIVGFVTDQRRFNFVVVAIVFGVLVTELIFLVQAISLSDIPDPLEKIRAIKSPLLVAPNDVLFFSIVAPLAAYIGLGGHSRAVMLLGCLYLILTLIVTIYMQSRQAVGVFLASLCLMALLWRPAAGIALAVLGAVVIFLVDWITGKALINKLVYLFPRRYVWDAAWQMFLDSPLAGQGPGMFKVFYYDFLEKAGYTIDLVEDRRPMNWAHSLYLEQLAERGGVGFFALVILIGRSLFFFISRLSLLSLLEKGLLASILGFLLAGVAEASLLRLWAVILIFLLLALSILKRDRLT